MDRSCACFQYMNVELDKNDDLRKVCDKIASYKDVLEGLAEIKISPEVLKKLVDTLNQISPITVETATALLGRNLDTKILPTVTNWRALPIEVCKKIYQ